MPLSRPSTGTCSPFPQTARFLQDPATVERLKQQQQAHLQSMLEDDVDEAYVARRRRVGDVHAHLGVNPQMFLGAYNQYLQYGLRQLAGDASVPVDEFVERVLPLLKAIFLDVELTLDAYFTEATQNCARPWKWCSARIGSCASSPS